MIITYHSLAENIPMSRVTRITAAALCCILLTACGQSGPLTLPDQSPPSAASQDGGPIPDTIPEAVADPAEVPDDEDI
jgi:predicted small lipoprotein YifL